MDHSQPEETTAPPDGATWSAWMPLMAAHALAFAQLPSHPGWLRVRRVDRPDSIRWLGWTPRGVRQTAERLSRQVHLPVTPYDDPAVPALELWREKQRDGASFEVSGVAPGQTH